MHSGVVKVLEQVLWQGVHGFWRHMHQEEDSNCCLCQSCR